MARVLPLVLLPVALMACGTQATVDWSGFDVLSEPACPPHRAVGGIPLSASQYAQVLGWGERFFREGAYGSERSVTDVMGVLSGSVEVPCEGDAPDCRESLAVRDVYVRAVDDLDGVRGNLFEGNGQGRTSDLVLSFPRDATLYGLPVPEEVHTGLDVEAGALWPIGLHPVPTDDVGSQLFEPSTWAGAGPGAPPGRFRLRLTCAACHYSLDVDNDGFADLDSARADAPTPGSPFEPHDAWGVGNQDLHFGWLFGLSANPLLGALVLGGDIGSEAHKSADASAFLAWLAGTYRDPGARDPADRDPVEGYFRRDLDGATREVLRGMLIQPRGYADVNSDAKFNTMQLPPLYTRHLWPANVNGAFADATDRNNTVWGGALDFTGLIGLCADRGGATRAPGEGVFQGVGGVPCEDLADLMLAKAPVDEATRAQLKEDILGYSDGIPGMLGSEGIVLLPGGGTLLDDPRMMARARERGIIASFEDYGRAGEVRRGSLALLGYRLGLPPDDDAALGLSDFAAEIGLQPEEVVAHALNVMMDWLEPPPNETALLRANAKWVSRGREVFMEAGCGECHTGPFFTDNRLVLLSREDDLLFGEERVPSTTGWRRPLRGEPTIDTQPERATAARKIRRYVSAPYDPKTGLPTAKNSPVASLMRVQTLGYRTAPLRHMWASAPYLHDGGVGVATRRPSELDLATRLAAVGPGQAVHGMGQVLAEHEAKPSPGFRPDAALSLQALVLRSERERVVAANAEATVRVPGQSGYRAGQPSMVSMQSLGVSGRGHDFYLDDVPGGPEVTALVAFLLALDDCPGDLPGQAGPGCPDVGAVPASQGLDACPQTPGLYDDLSEWYAVETP